MRSVVNYLGYLGMLSAVISLFLICIVGNGYMAWGIFTKKLSVKSSRKDIMEMMLVFFRRTAFYTGLLALCAWLLAIALRIVFNPN